MVSIFTGAGYCEEEATKNLFVPAPKNYATPILSRAVESTKWLCGSWNWWPDDRLPPQSNTRDKSLPIYSTLSRIKMLECGREGFGQTMSEYAFCICWNLSKEMLRGGLEIKTDRQTDR